MSVACSANLFGTRSQFIKTNAGDIVAVDGSGVRERLILSDLRIPYKQILKSRIILKAGQTNYLLNHLGLGDNATFLAIKATYDAKSVNPDNNYVNYSYYNYPVQNFAFAQLKKEARELLVGNIASKIAQELTENPSGYWEGLTGSLTELPSWLVIDSKGAAQNAILSDGVAEFLDSHDGEEIYLRGTTSVAFGQATEI